MDAPAGVGVPAVLSAARVLAVAYSGGRDSTALLHATLRMAAGTGLIVHALHVHHGLSAHADVWLAHTREQCRQWAAAGLPVVWHAERVSIDRAAAHGQSLEALARTARYAALAHMAQAGGAHVVLLAHHRRDQAETFLLQALRGAGAAGLAAMPRAVERQGVLWLRPWLDQPPSAIDAYVRRHHLRFVEDDSNADPRFARNRVRLAVWPALEQAFPQAEASLADAARRAAQAWATADAIAAQDLARITVDSERALKLAAWCALPLPRATHALRTWLVALGSRPTSADIERSMRELQGAAAPARWRVVGGELRRYRGELRFAADAATQTANGGAAETATRATCAAPRHEPSLSLSRAGRIALPGWGGVLVARRVREGGAALARLGSLKLVARTGGERFQLAPGSLPRSLKKQFQARALPAWLRDGPLLYDGDQLVFVPGLGLDARVLAPAGTPQLVLHWEQGSVLTQLTSRASARL